MATMAAVDLGAQSGRIALGRLDGERLSVVTVHRFPNAPVRVEGRLHWDILRLYDGVLEGLRAARREASGHIDSVGIDTWGVDFALLDRAGRLLQNPVHHRDDRSAKGMAFVLERVSARDLYARTGIQLMPINTVFQLGAMVAEEDPALEAADGLLLVPDLLHYWLSGTRSCEFTNATTTACLDPAAGTWASELLAAIGVPRRLFPEVVPPGTPLGTVRDDVAEQTRLGGTQVIAPATHDTGSAVAAVPFRRPGAAYISAGTWSLVGVELASALVDERTFAANLTNEGGVGGTFRLLRNVTGLWLLDQCRLTWAAEGLAWSFDELVAMAEEVAPPSAIIDPDDPSFAAPGEMPRLIQEFCRRTGQEPPETPGEIVHCVLKSIALRHRHAIELLGKALGAPPPEVHVVGGGARNRLLCQWTADATGLAVLAGPVEATEIGNLLVQALALGELSSLEEAREVVRASAAPVLYEPRDGEAWAETYARFEVLAARGGRTSEEVVA
jgi:rhamnulokinase